MTIYIQTKLENDVAANAQRGYVDGAVIARQIRSDIKSIINDERNKSRLAGVKVSVRTHKYAGGQSIYVTVTKSPFENHLCLDFAKWSRENPHASAMDYPNPHNRKPYMLTYSDFGCELMEMLEAVVERYHWSTDSGQPDDYYACNFFPHIDFDVDLNAECMDALMSLIELEEDLEADQEDEQHIGAKILPMHKSPLPSESPCLVAAQIQEGPAIVDDIDAMLDRARAQLDRVRLQYERAVKLDELRKINEEIQRLQRETEDLM